MSKITSGYRIHVYWFPPGTIGPTNTILDTGWYFSDECYSLCGPYSTEKLAVTAYDSYVSKLNNETPK